MKPTPYEDLKVGEKYRIEGKNRGECGILRPGNYTITELQGATGFNVNDGLYESACYGLHLYNFYAVEPEREPRISTPCSPDKRQFIWDGKYSGDWLLTTGKWGRAADKPAKTWYYPSIKAAEAAIAAWRAKQGITTETAKEKTMSEQIPSATGLYFETGIIASRNDSGEPLSIGNWRQDHDAACEQEARENRMESGGMKAAKIAIRTVKYTYRVVIPPKDEKPAE